MSTMNDLELLELAAKAVGLPPDGMEGGPGGRKGGLFWGGGGKSIDWNPLTDDGDALRLAAGLRIKVLPGKHRGDGCSAEAQWSGTRSATCFYSGDPAKQMRRAIVHVAAAIGEAMP